MGKDREQENSAAGKARLRFTDREKKILLIVFASIVFFFVFAKFGALKSAVKVILGVLRPILIGFAMAFLMNPMMKFMERHFYAFREKRGMKQPGRRAQKWIRIGCVVLSSVILVGLIVAFFSFVAPQFFEAVQNLMEHLHEKIRGVIDWADDLTGHQFADAMADAKTSGRIEAFIENAVNWISSYLNVDINNSNDIVSKATSLGTDAIMIFANFLIGLFLAIYMLLFKESYKGHIKRLLYAVFDINRANMVLEIGRKANDIFYGFIVGKILDSAVIGLICFVSMLIMRMPYPILCSFVVGVTNIIPVFGPYIGAPPTVILIFVTDPPKGIIFLIYVLILQQVDGNLIGPKILGDSTGITSFWVIVAVVVGGSFFGFIGMLIGVPTLALILYIVDRVAKARVQKKNLPPDPGQYIEVDHIEKESGQVIYLEDKEGK